MAEPMDQLTLEQRDRIVRVVMEFLALRGYTITAPGTGLYAHTDWEMLKDQKQALLEILDAEPPEVWRPHLEGLVHYLDHIQDEAEKQGYPVVFLTEDTN